MPFATWLQTWLIRHPLKEPTDMDRARYTAEVMARVKAVGPTTEAGTLPTGGVADGSAERRSRRLAEANLAPLPVRPWGFWPRLAVALAAATAGVAVFIGTRQDPSHKLAQAIATDAQLLAALDERDMDLVLDDDVDVLPDELAIADTMLLAEQSSSDEEWLAQTLELLDQLGEDTPPETASDGAGEEEWLEELQLLDEGELST